MTQKEKIHFAGPKPEDLNGLMEGLTEGLIAAHRRMDTGIVPAVVHAAAVAYGFVFLHPFEDGNGRIHRFLIHNILARRGLTPAGIVFPVSAAMLRNLAAYDASLESFSRPLMKLVEELAFLANYVQARRAIQEVVDMPDRKIDLFIQSCLQNNGRLSARKRASHFDFLSDGEVSRMEEAIRSAYGKGLGMEPWRADTIVAFPIHSWPGGTSSSRTSRR